MMVIKGLTKICRDAGTVRQRRKMPGLTLGQFCDAETVWRRHKTDAKRDAG